MKSLILISLMTALAIFGLACGGPTATPGTTITPTPVESPTPTLAAATPSPTNSPTIIPTPSSAGRTDEEAGKPLYEDPGDLFSVPIPASWIAEGANGYGILTAPDEELTFYVLAVEGSDVEAAVADA